MATSLTTQTRAFFFSSELPDLAWSTDQQEVHVRLYYQHTGNMLADVTLTASGGTVTLYETREIVERYMRTHALARLYPLQVMHEEEGYWQGDGALTVIYCEKNLVLPIVNGSQLSTTMKFWEDGHGQRFQSRNSTQLLACDTSTRNSYAPNYLQRIWDTTLGKEVICVDTANKTWKDAMGNTV